MFVARRVDPCSGVYEDEVEAGRVESVDGSSGQ